ncbi:LuxR C-terminal-related transcriptional regulator [Streptomyces sp. ST2-7A]|uniref:LuxR C-terminal-related transcriptional regulator n=1 Tax=Streptomyces sp. ST2-7A TaxID=2907214 RepID=UPI001F2FA3FD|nr:LuxR C-terminal-related transcriptional regulator [Streptomyces sp. ST2-7A]MCE7082162.1 LuxR C-terminal-related transcriptional regulator [Streptomyces sp. ST2-7A]
MSSPEGAVDEPPLLDEFAVDVYRAAVRCGAFADEAIAEELGVGVARVAEARKALEELRLLGPLGEDGKTRMPLDPEIVEAELISPLEMAIVERRRRIVRIHEQLRSLGQLYRSIEQLRYAENSIRVLDDAAEVRREIELARHRCTRERMSLQPGGGRSAELLQHDLAQTRELLRRGVRIRTLYQHTARASLATRAYVRRVGEEGGEVRTAEELTERIIIYDRRIAFVPKERDGREAPGAAVVTDPTMVAYLCRSFEAAWQVAQPFVPADAEPTTGSGERQTGTELRDSILRLMSMGLKDEVIARRLGMATRTCRRYISALMDELGATSRFQAGLMIGRQGAAGERDGDVLPGGAGTTTTG